MSTGQGLRPLEHITTFENAISRMIAGDGWKNTMPIDCAAQVFKLCMEVHGNDKQADAQVVALNPERPLRETARRW